MNPVLLLALLAQAPAPLTWSDGKRSYDLYESRVLVAEPKPTETGKAALLELGARLVIELPTMRVWKVDDAPATRARLAGLRPVLHDNKALSGRYRVPLALVCDGERLEKPWREVLEGSNARCLPDFWYRPVLK
jgi:hypothetical protein